MSEHKFSVVSQRDPKDTERKLKVRDEATGIVYWMVPTDDTDNNFVLRTIQ